MSTTAEDLIQNFNIPPQPDVLLAIQQENAKPNPKIDTIATLIKEDASLASALLKVVNSPFFGIPRQVNSISQAVMILGLERVIKLVRTVSMRATMQGHCSVDLGQFWDTVIDLAAVSTQLGKQLGLGNDICDEIYTTGMFRDIGIPILAQAKSDYTDIIVLEHGWHQVDLCEKEQAAYGTTHAELGFALANAWNLSNEISIAIRDHHCLPTYTGDLPESDMTAYKIVAILQTAEYTTAQYHGHTTQDDESWIAENANPLEYLNIAEVDFTEFKEELIDSLEEVLAAARL